MKDHLGHGSNPGAHSHKISALPRGMVVEKHVSGVGRTAAGQIDKRVGNVWQKVTSGKRRAVAERLAQLTRVDNPNALVRVR